MVVSLNSRLESNKEEEDDDHRSSPSGSPAPDFFFFTLVTGPKGSLSLKLSDTRVYEP